jgi:hypothetical protein
MDGQQSEIWPWFRINDALAFDFGSGSPLKAGIRLNAALAFSALRQ